jgi:broad specificity phosphatase PhoE
LAAEPRGWEGPHQGFGSGARVWLVRHAEVELAARGRAYGADDVALSPEGRERSAELARSVARLAPVGLYSSPLQRALSLAQACANQCGAPLSIEAGLAEVNRGFWQTLEVRDLHRLHPESVAAFQLDPWNYRGHGGESDRDVVARAWPVLERACLASKGANVALICHYNVARCLVLRALGLEPAQSFALRLDKARALLLEDRPGGFHLAALNLFDPGAFVQRDEHLGATR